MAVTSKNVAMTGSAVHLASTGTYARWITFCNLAAAAMAVADANVSLAQGVPLTPVDGTYHLGPMPDGAHYDLGQWYGIGTSTQNLTIIYDAMN